MMWLEAAVASCAVAYSGYQWIRYDTPRFFALFKKRPAIKVSDGFGGELTLLGFDKNGRNLSCKCRACRPDLHQPTVVTVLGEQVAQLKIDLEIAKNQTAAALRHDCDCGAASRVSGYRWCDLCQKRCHCSFKPNAFKTFD